MILMNRQSPESASTPISAGGWRYNPADPQDRIDFEHHGADELAGLERNRGLDFTDHPTRQSTTTTEGVILMSTTTRTLAVRIDTVRTDRKTGEVITTWSPHLTYPCTADTATQQAADVLRTHHTREAQPDGTWRNQPAPARGDGTVLDNIDWREIATLVGDWTDAERDEIRRIVDRDRHLPGGG
jgi:hypothetical protein